MATSEEIAFNEYVLNLINDEKEKVYNELTKLGKDITRENEKLVYHRGLMFFSIRIMVRHSVNRDSEIEYTLFASIIIINTMTSKTDTKFIPSHLIESISQLLDGKI